MTRVVATEEFAAWARGLGKAERKALAFAVGLLEAKGIALGHPYSSAIKGARRALRELRVQSRGRPLRVFYAFDPGRNAVLLLGGDKRGEKRFYERLLPKAEAIWDAYLEDLRDAKKEKAGKGP